MIPAIQRDFAYIADGDIEILVDIIPVPVGKAFAKVSHYSADSRIGQRIIPELTTVVDGNYTQLRLIRSNTNQISNIVWQVIYDNMFTVQHAVVDFSGAAELIIPINEVDTDKTWVVEIGTSLDYSNSYIRSSLSPDSLTLSAISTGITGLKASYFVISHPEATVVSGSGNMAWNASFVEHAIAEHDISNSFVEFGYTVDSLRPDKATIVCDNQSSMLKFLRYGSTTSGDVSYSFYLVSFPGVFAQQVTITMTSSTSGSTSSFIETDINRAWISIAVRNNYTSSSSHAGVFTRARFGATPANVLVNRGYAFGTAEVRVTVVEFEPSLIFAEPTSPVDIAIMPGETNTFIASIAENTTITAYEIQYMEQNGDWISTGKTDETVVRHIFPVDTFDLGKQYEWQVRVWLTGQSEPAAWSASAEFNTSNPVIQNPTPTPDSSIRVDIRDFGGRLKSPYGRDIQLTIEIANNSDFTIPTTYTLPFTESGTEAIMEHAIQEGGTWYVRLTATDTEDLQTVLEYSFFAGMFIQFIKLPDIDIEAQPATHVTVRVKGTTTEYTAVIDPAPSADRIVERLFYIPTGTLANCQAVAEAFLAKLGRRQLTVSGVIPLTVTLKIGQYVRVVVPSANINQDMILQRKLHRINEGEAATHVTLGDIKVSDQEMIARIVERLESQGM